MKIRMNESNNSLITLQCIVKPYDRHIHHSVRRVTVKGETLLKALMELVDRINVYIDSEDIEDSEMTAEDVVNNLEESNGDGCDMIYELKIESTGELLIDASDVLGDYDSLTESKHSLTEAADIRKYRVFSTFPEWLQKIESLNLDLRGIDPVCIALELAYRCEDRGYGPMRLPSAKAVKDNYYAGGYASRLLQDYEGFNGLSWGLTPEDEKYDEYANRYSKENVDNDAREMIQYIINSAKADTFNKWLN